MLTEQQRQERKNGIGGSDAAAVAGFSQYRTSYDVYADKLGISEPKKQTEAMYWGNIQEDNIIKRYEELTGLKVTKKEQTFYHDEYKFILGNIDGFVDSLNTIVEAKTARIAKDWGKEGTAEIPDDYLFQVAHYAMVLNVSRVDIPVLIGGSDFRIYKYERNDDFEKALLKKEVNFWKNHVEAKIPPPITKTREARREFLEAVENKITANEEIKQILNNLRKLKQHKALLDEEEEKLKTEIMIYMRTSNELVDEFGNVMSTWNARKSKRLNQTRLKTEMPDVYEKYLEETLSRFFIVK